MHHSTKVRTANSNYMHFFNNNRAFIVINPKAGTRGLAYFKRTLARFQDVFDYSTFPDINEFRTFIRKNLGNYDVFIAAGGDGTVNSLASELIGTGKILAVIPYGSGNGFAREMGFRKDIACLAENIGRNESLDVDVIYLNNLPCINMAGTGIDSFVAHEFHNLPVRGFFNYGITTLKIATLIRPFDIEIRSDAGVITRKSYMMSIANTRQFGNNALIAPGAAPNDGIFDIALLRPFPKLLFPFFAARLMSGKLKESIYLNYYRFDGPVVIKTSEKRFHIDGEPVNITDEISVSIRKKSLRVLKCRENRWV
ncbi:MAG TPA: diacylglycerol kinase family protein [Bacteroidales bacterium]|nr:diacylglycerol kinase family protein [Bacteroidales bacterium]